MIRSIILYFKFWPSRSYLIFLIAQKTEKISGHPYPRSRLVNALTFIHEVCWDLHCDDSFRDAINNAKRSRNIWRDRLREDKT